MFHKIKIIKKAAIAALFISCLSFLQSSFLLYFIWVSVSNYIFNSHWLCCQFCFH